MKLKYDEAVEQLKRHKIKYYPKYQGIPVDKFEREELLKVIDIFCTMSIMQSKHDMALSHAKKIFGLEF